MNKILIANRGEIAVRIMRACRELAIRSVAVYSEADRHALHVRLADEAYLIGPAPAADSYLRADRIIDAARRSRADAIHPGYGFLSERAHFARACADAAITFIGPPEATILAMGLKIEAKRLAQENDVPVVPGYNGTDQAPTTLQREAERIGYPLLIKASAGGGGKGMREVHQAADFVAALEGAKREAQAAFGDDTVLLEKLIVKPRHVEIQILADTHGNVVYLGERECSVQRRHQKIVEEAPSVALTPELRQRMGEAAVRVARAVGYVNAGTIELMLDQHGDFYFLEMNTRLQVEHPVTEFVTGLDLVQLQIAVARGEPLPFEQNDITLNGHAIEARIYAEDPVRMLPSIGHVAVFAPPAGPGVRNDAGLESGDEVTVNYDPMLAKLIVHGADRTQAIARMQQALNAYAVLGVATNIPLLQAIVGHAAFAAGDTTTDFLATYRVADVLAETTVVPDEVLCAAALVDLLRTSNSGDPWAQPWRIGGSARRLAFHHEGKTSVVQATKHGTDAWTLRIDDTSFAVRDVVLADALLTFARDGEPIHMYTARDGDALLIAWRGRSYRVEREAPPSVDVLGAAQTGSAEHTLQAPMPGTIIKVLVVEGDHVDLNQPLVVLEAMKMEHTVVAPYAGTVRVVPFAAGQLVSGGATLIELDAG